MINTTETASSGGLGVTGILTIIFAVLKAIGMESMANVPWWSFHPFQFSVFIFWTWAFWIIAVFFGISLVGAIVLVFLD